MIPSNERVAALFRLRQKYSDKGNDAAAQRCSSRIDEIRGQPRSHVEGCPFCDSFNPGDMFPPHDASSRCLSGGLNHCTCDTCF